MTLHFKAELVEPGELGQIRAGEARASGSVVLVEVFQMGSVTNSMFGRPRRLPGHRRADLIYTSTVKSRFPSLDFFGRIGAPKNFKSGGGFAWLSGIVVKPTRIRCDPI